MPLRFVVLSFTVLVCLASGVASAQNGQGANANPSATPPPPRPESSGVRQFQPLPLVYSEWVRPPAPVTSNLFNILRVYPIQQSAPAGPVYQPGNGIASPRPIRTVDPPYTSEATRQKIEGAVWLEGVVQTDGRLDEIRIVKSLDQTFGLDQAAMEAANKWFFQPGMKDGIAVPVRVTLTMEFRLASRGGSRFLLAPETQTPEDFARGAYKPGDSGVIEPKVKTRVDPIYSSVAMRAKIQGSVTLQIVVMPDGTVGRARVVDSLDQTNGLDQNALDAVLQWTFEPGTLNGQAVPTLLTITMEFRVR